jgi:hypothetical protein
MPTELHTTVDADDASPFKKAPPTAARVGRIQTIFNVDRSAKTLWVKINDVKGLRTSFVGGLETIHIRVYVLPWEDLKLLQNTLYAHGVPRKGNAYKRWTSPHAVSQSFSCEEVSDLFPLPLTRRCITCAWEGCGCQTETISQRVSLTSLLRKLPMLQYETKDGHLLLFVICCAICFLLQDFDFDLREVWGLKSKVRLYFVVMASKGGVAQDGTSTCAGIFFPK